MRSLAPLLLFGLVIISSGCNSQANDQMKDLSRSISEMTNDLSCDNNSHCKSIGYGDKPCGGFTSYLPYSTKTTDEADLIKKVEKFNALDKQKNVNNDMVSTCDILLKPHYACQQGKCSMSQTNIEFSTH
jgi:hypothetical protein